MRRELEQTVHREAVVPIRPAAYRRRRARACARWSCSSCSTSACSRSARSACVHRCPRAADAGLAAFEAIGAAAACLGNVGPAFGFAGPFGSYEPFSDLSTGDPHRAHVARPGRDHPGRGAPRRAATGALDCLRGPPARRFATVGIGRAGIVIVVIVLMVTVAPAAAETRSIRFASGRVSLGAYATEKGRDDAPAPRRGGYVTVMHARLVDAQGRPVPQERVMLHHVFFVNYGSFPGDRRGGDCRRPPARRSTARGRRTRRSRCRPATAIASAWATAGRSGGCTWNHRLTRDRVYLRYTVTVETDPQTPGHPLLDERRAAVRGRSTACRATASCTNVSHVGGAARRADRRRRGPRPRRRLVGRRRRPALRRPPAALLDARYGLPEDPIYNLSPLLHEPAPRSMSVATSASGWAVNRGDRLKITSRYANDSPDSAVMGIMHLYIAHGAGRPEPWPAAAGRRPDAPAGVPRRARPRGAC